MLKKKSRGWLAITLTMSLFLSLLLSYAGGGVARAEVNEKIDVVITELSHQRAGDNKFYRYDRAVLKFTYDASKADPRPGDSFTLGIGPLFRHLEVGKRVPLVFTPKPETSVQVGECVINDTSLVTCTFNENILGQTNIRGSGTLIIQATEATQATEAEFTVNGKRVMFDLPGEGGIIAPKHYSGPVSSKWASSVLRSRNYIDWTVTFNSTLLPNDVAGTPDQLRQVVWKDTLTQGQYFNIDPERLQLRLRDIQGDTAPRYELLSTVKGERTDKYGKFKITVEFDKPEKPQVATFTVTGPFQPTANYYLQYQSLFDTPDGFPVAGVQYSNTADLQGTAKGLKYTRSTDYMETFTVTVEMEDGFGGFGVAKLLSGTAVTKVAPGTEFDVQVAWQLPDGKQPADYPTWKAPTNPVKLTAQLGKTVDYPGTFPVGTTVTLTEDPNSARPAANVVWGEPQFQVGVGEPKKSASFVIGNKRRTEVRLTNDAQRPGSVSVGDYVWLDVNEDGKQDDTDQPLSGVTLTLTGPNGGEVTDVDGNVVQPTKTNDQGRYTFDHLPVLTAGQKYKVTVTAPEGFVSTKPGVGARDKDSSTGFAESEGLTQNGDRD
ncbi:SdrD B-like domain-containing protein, partial [Tessaracoccus sp. OH4464_COT-324]|uniref:DUF7926 domain-containing protein n=1 Tax=Tessaracoccus sp. OH4464_COT-324 TaxID=2491059 RepID=UPI00131A172B